MITIQQGWQCPNCHRTYSPFTATCFAADCKIPKKEEWTLEVNKFDQQGWVEHVKCKTYKEVLDLYEFITAAAPEYSYRIVNKKEKPIAWALVVNGEVRILRQTLEASKQAKRVRWVDYKDAQHVPLYPKWEEAQTSSKL